MMRNFLLIAVFIFALCVSVIARAPMGVIAEQLRSQLPAFSYASTSGTIWNGSIHHVIAGIQPLGDIHSDVDVLSLLRGQIRSEVSVDGQAIRGNGVVAATAYQNLIIEDVVASGNTEGLIGFVDEIRALRGDVQIRLQRLQIDEDGCSEGLGTAWTDILTRMESTWRWSGPELDGTIKCDAQQLILEMSGQNEMGDEVTIDLTAGVDLTGRLDVEVRSDNNDLGFALIGLGFDRSDAGYAYRREMP